MKSNAMTLAELANRIGCELVGDGERVISGAAPIEEAGPGEITFLANPRYRKFIPVCKAGAIILRNPDDASGEISKLVSDNPYQDFRKVLELLYPDREPEVEPGIHPTAVIHPGARLGSDVRIGACVSIEAGAEIGDRCTIMPGAYIGREAVLDEDCEIGVNVVIRPEVRLGKRVVVGDGTVIGFDGFGFAPDSSGYHKVPQVGTVVIGDDVDIGANCCIDRAAVGTTRIGSGTKLDNLIQVAHGVHIGEDTVIAAQTGISGSTKIGSRVMMGGQVGLVGHIELGDNMRVGAQAGVAKSFDTHGVISGYPARPHNEELRIEAALAHLPEMVKRFRELEKLVREGVVKPGGNRD